MAEQNILAGDVNVLDQMINDLNVHKETIERQGRLAESIGDIAKNTKEAQQAVQDEIDSRVKDRMDPAKIELEAAINATEIHAPKCPVYQNVDALPHTDPAEIKKNLVAQLTASVRWTQSVKNMVADGATDFTECGPGAVLQGLIKKIDGTVSAHGIA